jgi:hypothetical protein
MEEVKTQFPPVGIFLSPLVSQHINNLSEQDADNIYQVVKKVMEEIEQD